MIMNNTLLDLIQGADVEWTTLGEVAEISKGKQLNKDLLAETGRYPVINGGINPSGYWSEYNNDENTITVSQGGASAGFVNWMTVKFFAGAHCYVVKPDKNVVMNRYVYHFVKLNQSKFQEKQYGAGIPALSKAELSNLTIPIPSLEIQQKVVEILDKMTDYVTELTAELTLRQKQYSYYRDQLLTFPSQSDSDESLSVHWTTLGEIGEVTKLAGFEFTKYVEYSDAGNIIALRGLNIKGKLDLTDVKYIDDSDFSKLNRSKLFIGDMMFTYVGTVGQVALIDKDDKYYLAPNVARIRFDRSVILPEFMRQYFSSNLIKRQIDRFMQSSSMKNLTMENIRKFDLPVPPLTEQKHIVEILDQFDSLTSDLTKGLPREIALRQKQYEYWRKELLNFSKK